MGHHLGGRWGEGFLTVTEVAAPWKGGTWGTHPGLTPHPCLNPTGSQSREPTGGTPRLSTPGPQSQAEEAGGTRLGTGQWPVQPSDIRGQDFSLRNLQASVWELLPARSTSVHVSGLWTHGSQGGP